MRVTIVTNEPPDAATSLPIAIVLRHTVMYAHIAIRSLNFLPI